MRLEKMEMTSRKYFYDLWLKKEKERERKTKYKTGEIKIKVTQPCNYSSHKMQTRTPIPRTCMEQKTKNEKKNEGKKLRKKTP